jgi:hypothetical protein
MRQLMSIRAARPCAVLIAAFAMAWPALYNRYPLLFPDSVSYLGDGSLVARALFLRDFSEYYGYRSLIYSMGILPLHWNITPWPIVAFNALVTSYILWLVVRSFLPRRTVTNFLGLVIPLSAFTGLGWLVGRIMPDIFGPVLYLSIYLLVFAGDTLAPAERWLVILIAWWATASHATHLVLAGSICVVLSAVLLIRNKRLQSLQMVAPVATIVLAAALAQIALNKYLYGEASLNGNHPPFLLARILADGPGRRYLDRRCGELQLAACTYAHDLSNNVDDFLWGPNGWSEAPSEKQEQLRHEEMSVFVGTLLAYPREELLLFKNHFWRQLLAYGIYSYDGNQWMSQNIVAVLPSSGVRYSDSRQAQEALPEDLFTSLQQWTVIISLVAIGLWMLFARWLRSHRLIGLSVIITSALIINAAVTGALSNVEDRYQARVIWLVPLLAGILILTWLDRRLFPIAERTTGDSADLLCETRRRGISMHPNPKICGKR